MEVTRDGWLTALVAGLLAAAAGLAVLGETLASGPASGTTDVLVLLLLLVLACFLGVEFRARGEGDRLDLFDAGLAAAVVALHGWRLLLVVVLAKGLVLSVQRVPPQKLLFNLAQWACAAAAGSAVVLALGTAEDGLLRELAVVAVALVVVAAINTAAVLLVLVAVGGREVLQATSYALLQGTAVSAVVNLVLGLLVAALWTQGAAGRLVIPVALVAVHLGTRGWVQQQVGAGRLAGLRRAGQALTQPSGLDAGLPAFLEELRGSFGCRGAELQLRLAPEAPWSRLTVGDDAGAHRSAPLVAALLRDGRTVRLGPAEGSREQLALLAEAGWRDCLAVPVRFDGEVVGLLCLHDQEGWSGFTTAQTTVLEAAAAMLGEGVHRGELTAVLQAQQDALRDSELRWQNLALMLEQVAHRAPLQDTLELLARTLQDQTGVRCAVLVQHPGRPPLLVAPGLAHAARALEDVLLPSLGQAPALSGQPWEQHLDAAPAGRAQSLLGEGVHVLRAWALPCAPGSGTDDAVAGSAAGAGDAGARGVLALCYPDAARVPEHDRLALGAARVAALAVDHVLVQDQLAHQAAHDPLTDLPNRAVFLDRLGRALRSTARGRTSVLVLFLDLDRFKIVNDSLGHRAGDALLRAVADRLARAVRPGDTVARFGGDEFTVLCEGIDGEAHALQVVQRVQEVLAAPFPLGDSELFATASIGIALGRGTRLAPDTLLDDADAAMYRAKERGGNCFELFDAQMRDRAVVRLATQSALHRGLEREEFRVVYQPIVGLPGGRVEGVEALVRWDRPDHGVVAPADFVPLAEETGLIVPIGAYVLEQACSQARRWRDASRGSVPPWISVNLSASQLGDPDLVPLLRDALTRNGLDPSAIHLEITESVLMSDVSAGGVLGALKDLGVRLLIDDFGTGYSSLTYLQRFPVDGIKVDRSFVSGLGTDADAEAIVSAVIGLAHGLGLVAVAEGVETEAQVRRLIDLDCDVAQGYHFGRPSAADLVALPDVRRRRQDRRADRT